MSLLIVSRSPDKLERVRAEIREKSAPGATVEILAHDFTKGGAEADAFYARLAQVAGGLDGKGGVGLLVNNVGVNVEVPEFFHDLPEAQIQDIVRVNVESTVRMTRTILPFMAKRCVRRNVGRACLPSVDRPSVWLVHAHPHHTTPHPHHVGGRAGSSTSAPGQATTRRRCCRRTRPPRPSSTSSPAPSTTRRARTAWTCWW